MIAVALALTASPYEISIGMVPNEVRQHVQGEPTIQKEKSLNSDETWEFGENGSVYFCKGQVVSTMIPIGDSLRDWTNAVSKEQAERGTPALGLDMARLGVVSAIWRLKDGSRLSLTVQELRDRLVVTRWQSVDRVCGGR